MTKERRVGRAFTEAVIGGVLIALAAPLPLMALSETALSQQTQKPASPQAAQPSAPPAAPQLTFDAVDRNKDGFVDKSESGVVPGLSANFEKMDRNRDGKLDRDEFMKALAPTAKK